MNQRIRGALAPVLTPFLDNFEVDVPRYVAHCRWLVDNDAGLAIFGTNSEAASLSVAERLSLMDQLLDADIPASKMLPGTGACALPDAVEMARHASQRGAAGLLVLPPFFFKGVHDDGVFAYYAEIIERVGEGCAPVYLYHIPQFTQVPITLALIERLIKRYPGVVVGAKDSSGDWSNTRGMLEAFAGSGFDVFPASESFLSAALPLGAAGCISATVNVNPAAINAVFQRWNTVDGARLQEGVDAVRKIFQGGYMIPAMKHTVARFTGMDQWCNVRPPLMKLADDLAQNLAGQLHQAGFDMPNYPRVAEM